MAQKSRSAIATQITTDINDNIVGDITPAEMRAILQDSFDSAGTRTWKTFQAWEGTPEATNYPTRWTRNSIPVVRFDDTIDQSHVFLYRVPENVNLSSGIIVTISWMAETATSGNVRWGVAVERMNTDEDSDSFDTAVEANSAAPGTSGVPQAVSITVTTIDGLTAGDFFRLKVYRKPSDTTNDTMTGYAQELAVDVRSAI